jgi:sarcosine oxidase gamma subunit
MHPMAEIRININGKRARFSENKKCRLDINKNDFKPSVG